jgi:hypothetical protein
MSDGATDYIKDQIQNGPRDSEGKLINPIDPNKTGLGKSCQVYEPDLVNKLISDEAGRIVDELKAEAAEEQQKLQDEYVEDLTNQATCLSDKLDSYGQNKGGSNTSSTEFNNWANECGASDVVKNMEVEIDGKKIKLEDALKQGIDQVNDSNKRGTMEGCKPFTWPWAKDSCVSNGVGEIVHHTSEFLGDVTSFILAPITTTIETAWNSITTGDLNWDNFKNDWNNTIGGHRQIIDDNVSSITKNTAHGLGRVIQAVPGLLLNGYNAISALDDGLTDCITGKGCSWENVNKHYDKNTQAWQDTIGWNGGDWLDNVNIAAGATVTILGAFIGGPWGAVVASMVFSYTLSTAQNGKPPTLNEYLCEGKEGFDCAVNGVTNLAVDYLAGKILDGTINRKPKTGVDILDGNKKPKKASTGVDDAGIPCLRFSYAPKSILDYAVALFSPVRVNACDTVDPNRLNHIFGQPKHNLDEFLTKFGGNQSDAYRAIESSAQQQILNRGISQPFTGQIIDVNGTKITVNGTVISGEVKISTAYIP